jgi:O-antigen/teichoic acid export membrane protein
MRLGKNLIIYAGADLAGKSIGLLTSPILTRLLTPEQYGANALILATWGTVTWLQYGGMDNALPFFLAQSDQESHKKQVLATSTYLTTFWCPIFVALCILAAMTTPYLRNLLEISPLELGFFLLGVIPLGMMGWYLYLLRYLHQALSFARVSLLGRVAPVLLAIPALFLVSQGQRLAVMFAACSLGQILAFAWCLKELKLAGAWPYQAPIFSRTLARRMFAYGIILVPASVTYSVIAVADRLLVGWFAGPKEVALLALAISLGSVALLLKGWFSLVWDPHLVEWLSTGNPEIYLPKLQLAQTVLSAVFLTVAGLSAVWSDWVVQLIYPAYYYPVARMIPFIILTAACAVLSLVAVATVVIVNSPRYHLPIYLAGLALNVAIASLTIPKWGAFGAVLGTLASEFFILAVWVTLGKCIFKNLNLNWRLTLIFALLTAVFITLYHPGVLLEARQLYERGILTLLLLTGLAVFFWRFRPAEGWKKSLV